MAVVTISRGFGCSGEKVSEEVAERLNYSMINKQIIEYIAILADTPLDVVSKFDEEQHSNLNARLSKYIDLSMFKEMFSKSGKEIKEPLAEKIVDEKEKLFKEDVDYSPVFDSDVFRRMSERVFHFLADKDNVVIMGRGGQVVLQEHPDTLHVRLYAPVSRRVEWIASRRGIPKNEAFKLVEDIDKKRKNYLQHYYGENINDDKLYHMVINVEKLSIAESADMIMSLIDIKNSKEKA